MNSPGNRVIHHIPIRKRIRKVLRIPYGVKQLAWWLTAGWLWLWALTIVLGLRAHLARCVELLFDHLHAWLIHFGFAPSNMTHFVVSTQFLWLFAICEFSIIQLVGFSVYVITLPLILLVRILYRRRLKPYRKLREEALTKSRKDGALFTKRRWDLTLYLILLLWYFLYGQSSSRYPLQLGLFLTLILFYSRFRSALIFALPARDTILVQIENMITPASKFMNHANENISSGKLFDKHYLNSTIWIYTILLRFYRIKSRWYRGKSGRRRVALVVLLSFILNLAALAGISILFWAIAIKFALAPVYVSFPDALLASSNSVVPGIPAPITLSVPAPIRILDSLMAWMVFALYAGPVASLFPTFHEQAIASATAKYSYLRTQRRVIYFFLELLRPIRELVCKYPEIFGAIKAITRLRTMTEDEIREALSGEPLALRTLTKDPQIADIMRQLGVQFPSNMEELVQQYPPASTGPS